MIKAKDINENTPWQDLTPGGEIYEGGTAAAFNTGTWRTNTPIFHPEACKHCMLCVPFCPDNSIPVKDGKRLEFVRYGPAAGKQNNGQQNEQSSQ